MTVSEIIQRLELSPLPGEGGYFKETFRSKESSAIFYLVTPEGFSALHRLTQDEVFHFYAGDTVEMFQLEDTGTNRLIRIGSNLEKGESPQVVVPKGMWQGTRLLEGGKWALLGTTVAPPFDFTGFELADRKIMSERHPKISQHINNFTRI